MTDETKLDAETLAALLDGKLSDEERRQALDVVASSNADLELLADAAAALGDLDAEPGRAPSVNEGHKSSDLRTLGADGTVARLTSAIQSWKILLPLAAGIGAIALVPRLGTDHSVGGIWSDFEAIGAAVGSDFAVALEQVGGLDTNPNRGPGGSLTQEARSFRLGARYAELAIAIAAGPAEFDVDIPSEIDAGLVGLPGGGLMAPARLIDPDDAARSDAWAAVMGNVESVIPSPVFFELGLWVQRARLSAVVDGLGANHIAQTLAAFEAIRSRLPEQTAEDVKSALAAATQALESDSFRAAATELDALTNAAGG